MSPPLAIVILGLSLSSTWGNGHATTYRSLIGGLAALGHRVWFLERDVPWYAAHRDLADPGFCTLDIYTGLDDLARRHAHTIRDADAVIVGSYVPEGVAVIDWLASLRPRRFCFYDIDTPVTLARLDRGDDEYLARRQVGLFDLYLSFTGGPTLRRLERAYGARRAAVLHCSVDAGAYVPTGEPLAWDLGYLGTYSPDRQARLEQLLVAPARQLPQLRFVVAGSMYPADIAWPRNVERIEHLPAGGHASFYSRQRFTLNVTRADMAAAGWSPSVRLFEAAACGTAIISDAWRGLDEVFPVDEAVVVARTSADVIAALTAMDEADRRRMAATARTYALQAHTGIARAATLVGELNRMVGQREAASQ